MKRMILPVALILVCAYASALDSFREIKSLRSINLVSFKANYERPLVLLRWSTSSEINSSYFTVERTTGGGIFETIAIVEASGASLTPLNYSAQDVNPLAGLSYYRLKQTDVDGTIVTSDLVVVKVEASNQIAIVPNPVTGERFTLLLQDCAGVSVGIEILDLSGKLLYAGEYQLDNADLSQIEVEIPEGVGKGICFVRIFSSSGVFIRKISID